MLYKALHRGLTGIEHMSLVTCRTRFFLENATKTLGNEGILAVAIQLKFAVTQTVKNLFTSNL